MVYKLKGLLHFTWVWPLNSFNFPTFLMGQYKVTKNVLILQEMDNKGTPYCISFYFLIG